jgi:hypothetical protein
MYTPDDDSKKMDGKMIGKKHRKNVYKTICVFRRKNHPLTLDLPLGQIVKTHNHIKQGLGHQCCLCSSLIFRREYNDKGILN